MTSSWTGKLVRLRAIEPNDWEYYERFATCSQSERNVFRICRPRSAAEQQREAERLAERPGDDDRFALAIERISTPGMIGAISTREVDVRAGAFEYGLAVESAHRRHGYGSDAACILLRYMFGERRFNKCTVRIFDFNTASLWMHRRLGFVEEGRLRQQEFFAGRYCDVVVMGLLAAEYFVHNVAYPLADG